MSRDLDDIDLKILAEIQADGRITNVELARRVGISPPPCLRRVRALEEAGYIVGYRGLLDPRKLGFDVTVFASVHLSSQAEADLRTFEEFVRNEPLVRECWILSGEVDFHPQMRRARHEHLPGVRVAADGCAARPQRAHLAGPAQLEGRRGRADGNGGAALARVRRCVARMKR